MARNKPEQVKLSSSAAKPSSSAALSAGAVRLLVVAGLMLLFLAASMIAVRQLRSNAMGRDTPFLAPAWWIKPVSNIPLFPEAPPATADLTNVIAIPRSHSWWALDKGKIVSSDNDGKSWKPINLKLERPPAQNQAAMADFGLSALVMVVEGPARAPDPSKLSIASLWFSNEMEGYAGSTDGWLLRTTNRGMTWAYSRPFSDRQYKQQKKPPVNTPIDFIYFREKYGLIRDDGRCLWVSVDRGKTWNSGGGDLTGATYDACITLNSAKPGDETVVWAVGPEMKIERQIVKDGSSTGHLRKTIANLPPDADHISLQSITFLEGDRIGFAAGDHGLVIRTTDGGETWNALPPVTGDNLVSLRFTDSQHGFASAQNGAFVYTSDGGGTWHAARVYPAPWYSALIIVLLVGIISLLFRPQDAIPAAEKSIADAMAADKPLEPGDHDPLNLADNALGVTLFLANDNTPPPLTFAITGKWGAGKSSLMNLIGGQLRGRGFRPVCFNAWHSQSEESLLANLLQAIRGQAFPTPISFEGIRLRYRLLRHRMNTDRYRRMAVLSAACLSVFCGYAYARFGVLRPTLAGFPGFLNDLNASLKYLLKPESIEAFGTFGAILVSLLTLLRTMSHALTAFHVNPGALLATSSGSSSAKALSGQTSVRYRFAHEFKDVTETLNPDRSLLIMIDDLDRCKPQTVVQTLEAINFLVTSGDCFILVAMSREVVEKAIAVSYKSLWEELPDTKKEAGHTELPDTEKDAGHTGQSPLEFARNYLEKLFNIEVPVPSLADKDVVEFLLPRPKEKEKPKPFRERAKSAGISLLRHGVVSISATFLVGFIISYALSRPLMVAPAGASEIHQAPVAANDGAAATTQADTQGGHARDPDAAPPPPAILANLPAKRPPLATALVPGAVLIVLAALIVFKRPKLSVNDSDLFREVLDLWHPIIGAKPYTPRSLKRFLNAVRYFAMRQRDPAKAKKALDASVPLRNFLTGKPASIGNQNLPDAMRESDLIALATLFYVFPDRLRESGEWPSLIAGKHNSLLNGLPASVADSLRGIIKVHISKWNTPFTQRNLEQIRSLSQQFH